MADGGITTALIISAVLAAGTAAVSYSEARTANARAVKAAGERNKQLGAVYAAEGAQVSKKHEREQRRISIERHLATESLAASVANSGLITTSGSATLMQDSIGANFGQAALELTQESNAQQKAAASNLNMAVSDTYNTMAMNYKNPLMQGFQSGSQTFSLAFGTYASAASLGGVGSTTTSGLQPTSLGLRSANYGGGMA